MRCGPRIPLLPAVRFCPWTWLAVRSAVTVRLLRCRAVRNCGRAKHYLPSTKRAAYLTASKIRWYDTTTYNTTAIALLLSFSMALYCTKSQVWLWWVVREVIHNGNLELRKNRFLRELCSVRIWIKGVLLLRFAECVPVISSVDISQHKIWSI